MITGIKAKVRQNAYLRVLSKPALFLHWWRLWKKAPIISWIAAADEFRRGNFLHASNLYERGLRRHPRHQVAPYAMFDYAYCCFRLGRLALARENLSQLTRIGFALKDAFLLHARIETMLGDVFLASRILETGLRLFPNDIPMYCAYAQSVLSSGCDLETVEKIRERLDELRGAVSIVDGNFALLNTALARVETVSGNKKLAEQILARVIAGGAPPLEALLLRGDILAESGRVLQARLQYDRAIQQATNDPRPLSRMAQSYLQGNSPEEAGWALQLAVQICQFSLWQNPEYLKILSEAYARLGEAACAELVMSKLRGLNLSRALQVDEIRSAQQKIRQLGSLRLSAETESV